MKDTFTGRGEVRGFEFVRLNGNKQGFLYKVSYYDTSWYEVFLAKWSQRFGDYAYPGSKSFGRWAWSYTCLGKALNKFNSL